MEKLFKTWGSWASTQFPNQTTVGKVNHLSKEVDELKESIEKGKIDIVEIADCFGLLFSICDLEKIDYSRLKKAIEEKLSINKNRDWPKVPESDGSYLHIKSK